MRSLWNRRMPRATQSLSAGPVAAVWKTNRGPDDQPEWTDLDSADKLWPDSAVNIASITIFPVNDNPCRLDHHRRRRRGEQWGEEEGCPGSRFPDLDQRRRRPGALTTAPTTSLYRCRHVQRDRRHGAIFWQHNTARDREFVGTTAYQVTVEPELSPTGQVIIYAALSGPNGGLWGKPDPGSDLDAGARRQRDLGCSRPE